MSTQDLYIELLRRTTHHGMSPNQIADDLTLHRRLWHAVLPTRGEFYPITLRDLKQNIHNIDTLEIWAVDENAVRFFNDNYRDSWGGEWRIEVKEGNGEIGGIPVLVAKNRCWAPGPDEGFVINIWWD